MATVWSPTHEELRRSAFTLGWLLNAALTTLLEHSEERDDETWAVRFYKTEGWNENYDRDVRRFEEWIDRFHSLIVDVAKACNWFADVVRDLVDPTFLISQGKFLIDEGPDEQLNFHTSLREFSCDEKRVLPGSLESHLIS